MKRLFSVGAWLGMVVALSGNTECSRDHYEIEMKADGETLKRKLVCYHKGDRGLEEFPKAELDKIAGQYAEKLPTAEPHRHAFSGSFKSKTPDDVGGSGRYVTMKTRMGTSSGYMERFRGQDEIGQQLARAFLAADRLTDLLIGWAGWNLQEEPGFERLRGFLDRDLRGDLKDLLVYFSTGIVLENYSDDAFEEISLRISLYLIERGYFAPEDLSEITVAFFKDEVSGDGRHTMALVRRLLATKMGVLDKEPVPASLGFLQDSKTTESSLRAYIKTTKTFRRRLVKGEKVEPTDIIDDIIEDLLSIEIFSTEDIVKVDLHCPAEPYASNGDWIKEKSLVAWPESGIRSRPKLPTFVYAFWSEPDQTFQKRHFGKVVLDGRALGECVIWRKGLGVKEAGEWDAFVDGLRPGEDLAEKLGSFRFSHEKAGQQNSLADHPRTRILKGLSEQTSDISTQENP